MIVIQIKDPGGRVLDELRLHEEHHHPLLPSSVGSFVKKLMSDHLRSWASISIEVK